MISPEGTDRIWRSTKRSFYLVLIVLVAITVINFWDAHNAGRELPWTDILVAAGMAAWGLLVLGACWLIYRFIRRNAEFHERNK